MNIEEILETYRTALLRISSGMSSCIDGTISLDREDMQAIARRAMDKVAGLEFDEKQKQSNAELSGEEAVRSDALLASCRQIANNAIYFDDNSDYCSALREICSALGIADDDIGAKFIEANSPTTASQKGAG